MFHGKKNSWESSMDLVISCSLLTSFIFGVTPLFERILLKDSHFSLTVGLFARLLPALVVILIVMAFSGETGKLGELGLKEYVGFGILGILGSLVGPGLLFLAYRQPSGNISLIGPLLGSFPLFTVLAGFFIRGETITPSKIIGTLLVISGAMLLSFH